MPRAAAAPRRPSLIQRGDASDLSCFIQYVLLVLFSFAHLAHLSPPLSLCLFITPSFSLTLFLSHAHTYRPLCERDAAAAPRRPSLFGRGDASDLSLSRPVSVSVCLSVCLSLSLSLPLLHSSAAV